MTTDNSRKEFNGRVFLIGGFALTPAMVFVRGTSLSIIGGYILFLCLTRCWKWVAVFLVVFVGTFVYLQSAHRGLVRGAAQVDLATGEGLSDRSTVVRGRYEP